MRNCHDTSETLEFLYRSLYNEPHKVDWMSDYSLDWKCSPMMDTKRKFWLSHVYELWSVKVVQVKHFPGSWWCCECYRCCEVSRGNLNRDRDEFLMSNAAPRIDYQFLLSLRACFFVHFWILFFVYESSRANEDNLFHLCNLMKREMEEKETVENIFLILLQRWCLLVKNKRDAFMFLHTTRSPNISIFACTK